MKANLFWVAAALSVLSALPAGAATTVVGKGNTVDCFDAAQKAARGMLPVVHQNDALASCNAALADKPVASDLTATLINRGVVQGAMGRYDDAIADYEAAMARAPGNAEAYMDRGLALSSQGRYELARADFDHALALGTPSAHLAYFNRAVAQEKSGNLKAAYLDYRQALAVNPDFEPAKRELVRFHVVERRVANNH
jgi:tetratricopeptide (TPR) repeat protein